MTDEQKSEALKAAGWSTYYRADYWVHPDTVADPSQQDYTNYGMCADDALAWMAIGRPKHQPMGIPGVSRLKLALDTQGMTVPVGQSQVAS